MIDSEVGALAEAVLGPMLGPFGFVGVEAHSGSDHFDEPALFVTARLEPSQELNGHITSEAAVALHDALRIKGEHRFPYLSFDFLGEDAPFDPVETTSE